MKKFDKGGRPLSRQRTTSVVKIVFRQWSGWCASSEGSAKLPSHQSHPNSGVIHGRRLYRAPLPPLRVGSLVDMPHEVVSTVFSSLIISTAPSKTNKRPPCCLPGFYPSGCQRRSVS
ncbi:hypothetical protein PM082_018594 [Marasmius tenuissimus]|nr:hypothetical protein PM082_018594 [Marasmius tenuissimus]